jgi:hypothetical protein
MHADGTNHPALCMQYIVDNILNGLDAAKNDIIQFLIGYGFVLNPTTESEQKWNKDLYLSIKDNFAYFEDQVRVYFMINFLLLTPNHRCNPAIGTWSL